MSQSGKWEHFHHVADIGVRGYGNSISEAFEQAAKALTAVITDPDSVRPEVKVDVSSEAPDNDYLLVDWLNLLIYEMAIRHMIFSRFKVEIEGEKLNGTAWGELVDQVRHSPAVEIKGATYTALKVEKNKKGIWIAQCVVDV